MSTGKFRLLHGNAGLAHGGSIEYFRDAVFNYTTLAEAYKVAALNGLNKLYLAAFHLIETR